MAAQNNVEDIPIYAPVSGGSQGVVGYLRAADLLRFLQTPDAHKSAHYYSDTDKRPASIHHTLGLTSVQAKPGA